MMKASVEVSPKQATESQALSTKVATMSSKQDDKQNFDRQEQAQGKQPRDIHLSGMRQLKPTPQNQQRINYARQSINSQRSFRSPTREAACGKFSLIHPSGSCPAYGQLCGRCGRAGHFARACRSARGTARPTPQ
jgi:hypothetical protein